jgi:hypothetical protein
MSIGGHAPDQHMQVHMLTRGGIGAVYAIATKWFFNLEVGSIGIPVRIFDPQVFWDSICEGHVNKSARAAVGPAYRWAANTRAGQNPRRCPDP